MRLLGRFTLFSAVLLLVVIWVDLSAAQPVSDIIGFVQQPGTSKDIPGTTLNVTNNFPTALIIDETNIDAIGFNFVNNPLQSQGIDPDGDGDIATTIFERNSHIFYFQRSSPTAPFNFNRNESIDLGFDFQLDATYAVPRKEAGFFFALGASQGGSQQAQFIATSNNSLFDSGPGEIAAFAGIPFFNFSSVGADYNDDGKTDAADYTIWRDTFGTVDDGVDPPEDMRANGDNTGESENRIDRADYDVWKDGFGGAAITFGLGRTISMRLIYTPPVLNALPYNPADPGANVAEPGTMEYIISVDGSGSVTSGALDFTNAALGIPDGTYIGARAQYQGFPNNAPFPSRTVDSGRVSFTNFDLNGPSPGNGFGSSLGNISVPEPGTGALTMLAMLGAWCGRRRRCYYAGVAGSGSFLA